MPMGLRQGRLHLKLKAPPVEGKANREVLRWAAKAFGIMESRISMIRGQRSRQKDLLLVGLGEDLAAQALDAMLGSDQT
jgi:uncharacterized protein (TIGR00251 family)